jgi:GPH family glycoside/pentoside/hexuronide:cation symporter
MAKNSARTSGEQSRASAALAAEASTTTNPAAIAVGESVIDDSGQRLKIRERLAYGVGDVGGNLIFAPVSAFILFYFTDVVGIGAAIAGTLLLLGRVLDGTLDLIVGTLIDRTTTRWGKARPWILFSTPVLVLSFIGLFNVPAGLDTAGKEAYAFVFYFLCLGVGFVGSNLAYHTLLSVITSSSKMRVSLTVLRTFFAILTTLVVSVATVPLITALGGGQGAWTSLTLVYGGIAAITFVVLFLGTKERVRSTLSPEQGSKLPLRIKVGHLIRNPYFFLAFAFFLVNNVLAGSQSVGIYFASDVLQDANLYSFLGLVGLLPLLIGIWFMAPIIARVGKRKAILAGLLLSLVGAAIALIDPTNITLVLVGLLVRAIGLVPQSAAMFALVADVVDYGEWKSGVRLDGMTYAAATAGQNFGAGLGAALVGWVLAAGAYDPAADTQAPSAIAAEVFLMLWLPVILVLAQLVVVYFFNVDKTLSQIQRELAARRQSSLQETQD